MFFFWKFCANDEIDEKLRSFCLHSVNSPPFRMSAVKTLNIEIQINVWQWYHCGDFISKVFITVRIWNYIETQLQGTGFFFHERNMNIFKCDE